MITEFHSEAAMKAFGQTLGKLFNGGEVLELVGDVGAGKTTLAKGIAVGMGIDETVQSPSFTISRVYDGPHDIRLAHYDFYRLHDAGIMANELSEATADSDTVTIIEWAGIVDNVLPDDRLRISITSPSETSRRVELTAGGPASRAVLGQLA